MPKNYVHIIFKLTFLIFSLLYPPNFYSQSNKIDSLKLQLQKSEHDTTRCNILFSLTLATGTDFDVWPVYNEQLTTICETNLKTATGALRTFYLTQLAHAYNSTGYLAELNGEIAKALEFDEKSLKIKEEIGDKFGMTASLSNIAVIYFKQGDAQKAFEYYERVMKIQKEIGAWDGLANSLNNMGAMHYRSNNPSAALKCFTESLALKEEFKIKTGVGTLLSNIGSMNEILGNNQKALEYYAKSLKMRREQGDDTGVSLSFNKFGSIYLKLAQSDAAAKSKYLRLAYSYSDSSLALSKELGFPENIRNAELTLSRIDSARGNYNNAFSHYKQYIIFRDSISNNETRKASVKSQLKYEFEKKEAVIKEQQEKERIVAQEKNHRQQIVIIAVCVGLLLVIGFAGFVFRSLKTTRHQKEIIEEKQKEILDSIRYAKRIQQSLLPREKYIEKSIARLHEK